MLAVLSAILFIVISFLIVEKLIHEKKLRRIRIRIHVNGIRGKSSVTRLISAELRAAGIRTMAKVTGEIPRMIYPDGSEKIIRRRGLARIQEQVNFIRKAVRMKVDAVIMECMAIDPHLQDISETDMIQSHIGIITNVRPDHFEVMGKTLDDIAESLSRTIPRNGILITADANYYSFFKSRAEKRNTVAYLADDFSNGDAFRSNSDLFFADNLLIVHKVCSCLGITPAVIQRTPENGGIDPTSIHKIEIHQRSINFIDSFSANDIVSAGIIQRMTLHTSYLPRPFIAILNNRSDRPLRMLSFVSYLSKESLFDYILLMGGLKHMARRFLKRFGIPDNTIVMIESRNPKEVIEEILNRISFTDCTIIAMGNFKGAGERLSYYLKGKKKAWFSQYP